MIKLEVRYSAPVGIILLVLFLVTASISVSGQSTKDTGTDLQFHKFQPDVAPDKAVTASDAQSSISGIGVTALQQMQALQQDKAARTPAQQKIDSNIIYTMRMMAGKPVAAGVPYLNTGIDLDANNNIVVDMVAHVTDELLQQLTAAGAQVLYQDAKLRSIRAIIPPNQIEGIASSPDVIFISPKQGSSTARVQPIAPLGGSLLRLNLAPGFERRAANVRRQLAMLMFSTPGTPITWQGKVGTEGDLTHQALDARGAFGINGAGLKIGVLSDGVTSAALSQATGDLPPTCGTPPCLTVLAGQTGAGDEGTAMMEIIHDMVPGASLFFATADNSITSFAANIRALQTAGCQIIVDDVFYFVETPFQDGQTAAVVSTSQGGVVIQAVNDVVAAGAFYFSSAGNEGGLDAGTSGTFEGDFVPQAAAAPLPSGNVHNFGSGNGFDTITSPGEQVVGLFWADPLGGSGNDYDLYLLNSTGASILGASTNIQNGTQDPVELIGSANVINNNRLVVFQHTGAANRFFHLVLFRGRLAVATSGETHGHSAASGAYTVAATPAATSAGAPTPNGPFPGPFTAANQTEFFSSDGLRHIFFNGDSSAITPGNFSATGGSVLNKPDITAADGVSVTGVGGFGSPFFGTSAAAPSAASVAALVLSAKPTITAAQMRTALTSTAIDIMAAGFDRDAGNGIVMALPAVQSLGVAGTANPEMAAITANENPGNGNGIIERGEGASLSIQLKNTGGVQALTGVTATLTSSTPGVIVTRPGTSAYANVAIGAVGGVNLSPFTFTLTSNYPCGQTADFALTVNFTGGTRVLNFSLPTGLLSITNTLGTTPPALLGVTTATGAQVNRINRNGVISACGTPKAFPGAITGSHTFDSYTFTTCQAFCMTPILNAGAAGINLFESAYTPSYTPSSIGTSYAGDAGLSTNIQSFGITTTASTQYTVVVSDVAGNPLPPPAPPNTYTIQIPSCAFNCNVNQLPVAIAQNVTVFAGPNGTANANVDNGSHGGSPGELVTITQIPPGPYPLGTNNVILTVVDPFGATAQADAIVTVGGFSLTFSFPSILVAGGQTATNTVTFASSPAAPAVVNFTCSATLPRGSACSVSPSTLPAGSTIGSVTVTITTTQNSLLQRPRMFYAAWMPFAGMGLIGMIVVATPKKRRKAAVLLTFVVLGALVLLAGCGGGGGAKFGPIPVTVTATSGTITQTATFNLTIQD
ncbi:MAG TPA: S8 family serine peptidase [Candidatus Angelobacter sp.]|nr:S8 family serine peptidase [Candidatus Angelobacter sp.]